MKQEHHKKFSEVKLYKLPVGRMLSERTFLSGDEITQKGIDQIAELMKNPDRGLLVFFAHLGSIDAFATAISLERLFEYTALFPAAGSWYHFPILSTFFKKISKQVPHKFMAVYRKEEIKGIVNGVRFLDFSGLSIDEKKAANTQYVVQTYELLKNGGVVMLAPYAGSALKLENLRNGPVVLMQSGIPVLFTLTIWNWKKMKYDVFFSRIEEFSKHLSHQDAHQAIFAEYLRMAKLSGANEKKLVEYKSGKVLLTSWKVLAFLLSVFLFLYIKKQKK